MPETLVAPAHLWVPEHTSTAGAEAADLAASVGMDCDPEQRLALDAILAETPEGRWAALEAALICPRQNLKTFVLRVIALADLFLFDTRLVIWTAHLFPTTMEAFRDLKATVTNYDALRRRVHKVSEANGEEAIELVGGQRLLFKARSKSGGRGFTGDRIFFDEAQILGASEMGSLFPTLRARPNPQVVYAASAGKATSEVLRGVRNRGRPGGDPSLVYVEWCAAVTPCEDDRCDHRAGTPGCALDDHEAWHQANPALGRRVKVEHMEAERRALPPEEFARELMGWWEEPAHSAGGLPAHLWQASVLETEDYSNGALLGLAVDVTPESSWASIGTARRHGEGVVLEVVAHRRGTSWAADEVLEIRGDSGVPVVCDVAGPASVVDSDLRNRGIEPLNPSARDVASACAGLLDSLIRETVWHFDQPDLNAAVGGAVRGPLGDAWKWSRKSSLVDISPLVAVTLANWVANAVEPTAGYVSMAELLA